MKLHEEYRFLGEIIEEGSSYLAKRIMNTEYGWNDDKFWIELSNCVNVGYARLYTYGENNEFIDCSIDNAKRSDEESLKNIFFEPLEKGFQRYNEIWPEIDNSQI